MQRDMDEEAGMECEDTYTVMRHLEEVPATISSEAGDYAEYRRILVDWICESGEATFGLAQSTNHVACCLMDRVCGSAEVHRSQLQLIAGVSLVIAAKYEEAEERVPNLRRLLAMMRGAYSAADFHRAEVLCLAQLEWNVGVVTVVHALEYFGRKGVIFETDTMAATGGVLVDKVPSYCEKYMRFFADLCLQHPHFSEHLPTRLAAAVIVAARRAVGVAPVWNHALIRVVEYQAYEIQECYDAVWAQYTTNFPEEAAMADGVYDKACITTDLPIDEKFHPPTPTPTPHPASATSAAPLSTSISTSISSTLADGGEDDTTPPFQPASIPPASKLSRASSSASTSASATISTSHRL